jgi:hypothetical protein
MGAAAIVTVFRALAGLPLIAAAPAAGDGLDTPTLLLMTTAIVGVVLLRGVLLRRHLRKRGPRRVSRAGTTDGDASTTGADSAAAGTGSGGGESGCSGDGGGGAGCD